jgi:hypothetical protein
MIPVVHNDKRPSPLDEKAFPKTCSNCKKVYATDIEFFQQTTPLPHWPTDIKVIKDNESSKSSDYLEVFRNCSCGSTLMEVFHCRRDISERGIRRREEFQRLLDALVKSGYKREAARAKIFEFIDLLSYPER